MTLPDLTSLISQQLAQHGVSVEERVARDVAANILQCLEPAPALRHQIDQLQANFAAWVEGLKSWRPSDDNNQPNQGIK